MLHAAAVGGCCEIVDILLEKGCDLSSSAKDGCSIMHYAALGEAELSTCMNCCIAVLAQCEQDWRITLQPCIIGLPLPCGCN